MFTAWSLSDGSMNRYMRHNGLIYEFVQSVCFGAFDHEKQEHVDKYAIIMYWVDLDGYDDEEKEIMVSACGYHLDELKRTYGDGANDIVASCFMESLCMHGARTVGFAGNFEEAGEAVRNYIGYW